MGEFAQIWLPTIPVNARENTWEETVNTVRSHVFLLFFFLLIYLFFGKCLSVSSCTFCSDFETAHIELQAVKK